jgi:hypothetical protein
MGLAIGGEIPLLFLYCTYINKAYLCLPIWKTFERKRLKTHKNEVGKTGKKETKKARKRRPVRAGK